MLGEVGEASGPFVAHGLPGMVRVRYGVNRDPAAWGYGALGLPYGIEVAEGFPVVEASVAYEGAGYLAYMGWIQVLRYRFGDGEVRAEIDRPPAYADIDSPLCASGPCPSFFDAPSTTRTGVWWRADAFLVVSPDAVMSKTLMPVYGFGWGYDVDGRGAVSVAPCRRLDLAAWAGARSLVTGCHPTWRLLDPSG